MYYGECTAAYAREVIKEILANTEDDRTALSMIHNFMDGELTTDEIADLF